MLTTRKIRYVYLYIQTSIIDFYFRNTHKVFWMTGNQRTNSSSIVERLREGYERFQTTILFI